MLHVVQKKIVFNHKEYNLANKQEQLQYWSDYSNYHLLGKTIENFSYLSQVELDALDWSSNMSCLCVEFTDGTTIFPSADEMGSEAGHFSLRSSSKNIELQGSVVMEAGLLSPEKCEELEFDSLAPYFRVLTKKKQQVLFIAQRDDKAPNAGAIFGSNSKEEELFIPMLDI